MSDRTAPPQRSSAAPSGASDIHRDHWLYRLLPAATWPYLSMMRADRPIGTWLLFLPCLWALLMAPLTEGQTPEWWLIPLFALGAFVMRGAGCTFNDIADRDIDAKVGRTAGRPLPSGQVSLRQALVFLAGQLLVGFLVLICLPWPAIWLGVASLALVFTYPFMKRVTYWPQAFLGFTFNWGALLAWAASVESLAWPAVALYLAGLFWTLGYDTIYAHQDREDDALIGVKSTALKLGRQTRPWVAGFYLLTLVGWGLAGWLAGLGWIYALGLLAAAVQLTWQVATLDIDDGGNCLTRFKSNKWAGLLLAGGVLASPWLA
ncbi:MAG: 4-hydroxybenzoate octaprenyltransferase [Rhodospirillales bacterium]